MVERDYPDWSSNRDIPKLQCEMGEGPCPEDDCNGMLEKSVTFVGGTRHEAGGRKGVECTECLFRFYDR